MDIIMNTPELNISQDQLKLISEIDEFKGKWQALSNLAPDQLESLRKVAMIESIGSSTRIEGAKLTDKEIEELLSGIKVTRFKSRDEEEVAGYAECMEMVFESYEDIPLSENHIKQLHQVLLKYSSKDVRHRGEYKKLPNHLEAFDQNGKSLGIVFETASPFDTPQKMNELVQWFQKEQEAGNLHALFLMAMLIVHFLAIHPFQDGNGRLSRILTTLLLFRAGYTYVAYSSMERIVEENKDQYYLALRRAQKTIYSNNSTLSVWITFFLKCLRKQVEVLESRIRKEQLIADIPSLSTDILQIAKERGRVTVRDAVKVTGASRNTVKAHIKQLVRRRLLQQKGIGKGTWYQLQ